MLPTGNLMMSEHASMPEGMPEVLSLNCRSLAGGEGDWRDRAFSWFDWSLSRDPSLSARSCLPLWDKNTVGAEKGLSGKGSSSSAFALCFAVKAPKFPDDFISGRLVTSQLLMGRNCGLKADFRGIWTGRVTEGADLPVCSCPSLGFDAASPNLAGDSLKLLLQLRRAKTLPSPPAP